MKIAILSFDNSKVINYGGKHIHQNLLERALKILGHDVTTFYPPIESKKFFQILKIILSNPASLFSYYVRYKKKFQDRFHLFSSLKLDNFDIVHCHDVGSLYNIDHPSTVLTLHGYLAREAVNYSPTISEKDKRKIFDFCMQIEKSAVKKAKHIITVDSRLKNYVIQEFGYPEDKVTVIYNAVDTDLFKPVTDEEKILLRGELGFPKDTFIVFVPRRYVKKNGVDYAARAFSKIKSNDYLFVFAGRGLLKSEIQEILKDNSNALILDAIPNAEIHKYYKAADLILIPSVSSDDVEEATSLSMLEGMACGKVVVCTNVGGMKEVVKHMENGILIEQKNVDAIVETLHYVKNNYDNFSELRQRAREYVVKNHSYIEHAKKIVEIYEKVISETRR
ncbi:glycosyltransferase family 4 protein [Fervidobacterium nodosum]|uniref:Glycosyl transferase group 1 n=1 Tax=Fervidobacterium nodosum (strain ATCC 35602 / DSM 5306 / Rt17-B1) TaxID=381764 RepID=A7HKK5_FERNB|nr:glycosyltransferase family 4 protein [Fervidobacterium nodosum]ABS60438.1 glycosyl transferase group 1 [Fervidobacterium nodosum Rt17-B1]